MVRGVVITRQASQHRMDGYGTVCCQSNEIEEKQQEVVLSWYVRVLYTYDSKHTRCFRLLREPHHGTNW